MQKKYASSPKATKPLDINFLSKSTKKLGMHSSPLISPEKSSNSRSELSRSLKKQGYVSSLSNSPPLYQIAHKSASPKLSFPISASRLASQFSHLLKPAEKNEIFDYEEVYYIGPKPKDSSQDFDLSVQCDDDQGNYIINPRDHIAYRYEILSFIGKGTFGQVIRCFDHKRNEEVAIKIIKNKKKYHKQAVIELKILQKLRQHDPGCNYNYVKIKNYFLFRKHICISFELLSINLYELLVKNDFEGLSLTLIHRFAVQILVCLQYISRLGIVHCDLKPENIMLRSTDKPLISVIDFGSACYEPECVGFYIQSRFYRSPEVILGVKYAFAIDMWSLGCILAELYTGAPLFPGENEQKQLEKIIEVIGFPPDDMLKKSTNKKIPIEEIKSRLAEFAGRRSLNLILRGSSQKFLDFITRCLSWEPQSRLKPLEGLEHQWITDGLKRGS